MASHQEAREEYCRLMGDGLGTAYHLLWNSCALLHMRWEEYVLMFGSEPEHFEVMNDVAPGFFKSVHDNAWESILLHLCRFADPYKVSHRRTLSLEALLQFPASTQVNDLISLVNGAKSKIRFAQDWRNRIIAHADLDHALKEDLKPLADASRSHVRAALSSIVSVLETVDRKFTGSSLMFDGTGFNWGGTHLLRELRLVSLLRREREERIAAGQGTQDDFDYAKWR